MITRTSKEYLIRTAVLRLRLKHRRDLPHYSGMRHVWRCAICTAISLPAVVGFGHDISELPLGVGNAIDIDFDANVCIPIGCFNQWPDPPFHGHNTLSAEIPVQAAAGGLIGNASGFASASAHAAHAFAEIRGDPSPGSGLSHVNTGSGWAESVVSFLDRWTFTADPAAVEEAVSFAYIFLPSGSLETFEPPNQQASAFVNIHAETNFEVYDVTIFDDGYINQVDPVVNALHSTTSTNVQPIVHGYSGSLTRTNFFGAFAINDPFIIDPAVEDWQYISELDFELTARAVVDRLTGLLDAQGDPVPWEVPSTVRATVDVLDTLGLAAILVKLEDGSVVTPESLGINVTSKLGLPSPNVVPYEWALPQSGFWRSGSWSRPGVPSFSHERVVFGSAIEGPSTIAVDDDAIAPVITFDNVNEYVVGGTGRLDIVGSENGVAQINVVQGSHQFQVDVSLSANVDVQVNADAQLTFNGPLDLNGNTLTKFGPGTMAINNRLNASGGEIVVVDGVLIGSGAIIGDINNANGTLSPGNSPGRLIVDGAYSQGDEGVLLMEIGDTAYDVLDVRGVLTAKGSLRLTILDGFTPQAGAEFDILEFDEIVGRFGSLDLAALPDGMTWNVGQLYSNGKLAIASVPEPTALMLAVLGLSGLWLALGRASRLALARPFQFAALFVACVSGSSAHAETLHHWRFEDSPGFLVDSVGGADLEVISGATQVPVPDGLRGQDFPNAFNGLGPNESAASFVGVNGNSLTANATAVAGGFTIELLYRADNFLGPSSLLADQVEDFSASGISWAFQVRHDGWGFSKPHELLMSVSDGSSHIPYPSGIVLSVDTDYYLAASFDIANQEVKFHVQDLTSGTPLQTNSFSHSFASVNPISTLHLGDVLACCPVSGIVDEVRLSDSVLSDEELLISSGIVFDPEWKANTGGFWHESHNWTLASVPVTNQMEALFADTILAPSSIIVEAPVTVKSITFDNPMEYAIVGGNVVTFESNTALSTIAVVEGSHQFQAPIHLNSNVNINVAGSAELSLRNMVELGGHQMNIQSGTVLIENTKENNDPGSVANSGLLGGGGTITGDLTNTSVGVLLAEISDFGEVVGLHVTGTATLNGMLEIEGNYKPSAGESFTVLTAGAIAPNPTLTLTSAADEFYDLLFTPSSVVLIVTTGLAGDYSNNGVVDAADYTVWRNNLGAQAGTLPNDIDGDVIGAAQYATWRAHFGETLATIAQPQNVAVPEPRTSVLLGFVVGLLVLRHHRTSNTTTFLGNR